jgi:hypothetical protein
MTPVSLRAIVADELRLLTFRPPSGGAAQHWRAYLAFGPVLAYRARPIR